MRGAKSPTLRGHAPPVLTQRVRLEGYTDERGAAEFSLSIGSVRAERLKRALIRRGTRADQVDAISCGEEAPSDPRHDA